MYGHLRCDVGVPGRYKPRIKVPKRFGNYSVVFPSNVEERATVYLVIKIYPTDFVVYRVFSSEPPDSVLECAKGEKIQVLSLALDYLDELEVN